MKKYKIAYWITTTAIFLFEGVLVAFTWNSEMSRQGIMSLGYPAYFVGMLAAFKVLAPICLKTGFDVIRQHSAPSRPVMAHIPSPNIEFVGNTP